MPWKAKNKKRPGLPFSRFVLQRRMGRNSGLGFKKVLERGFHPALAWKVHRANST